MEDKKETFTYTYSAQQREEINQIRQKYMPREEDKMEQLRRLDQSVTMPGMVVSLAVGIISTLILGFGMCCVLEWADRYFVFGIVIGIVGIAGISAAYPLYTHITKKQREKLAPEIMRLSDELLK
ncbi:MAG: hypothetical protein ACI4SS_01115 [Clostridia bacterium]